MFKLSITLSLLLLLSVWGSFCQASDSGASFVYFEYKDWLVVCDNGNTCRAAGYSEEMSDTPAALLFTREAGGNAPMTGKIQLQGGPDDFPQGAVFYLSLNGRDLGDVPDDGPLSDSQVQALILALPGKADIVISHGNTQWHVSDRGATAIFRKMDEVQGRLDSTTAVVVKGNKPASLVPQAPSIPVIHQAAVIDKESTMVKAGQPDFDTYLQLLKTVQADNCDAPLTGMSDEVQFELAHLTPEKSLLMASCWYAAYNFGAIGILINAQAPFQPEVIDTNLTYYQNGEVGYEMKGRGIGDCWSFVSWVFDGEHFVKAEESDAGMCRGIAGGVGPMPTYTTKIVLPEQQ